MPSVRELLDLLKADPGVTAALSPAELEDIIRSTGFYQNKARSLVGMATAVVERDKPGGRQLRQGQV